jgi:hypothetical protein
MPTWLDIVKMEVENMDPGTIKDPSGQEVNPDCDTVIATSEDVDLKKLFTIAMQWKRTAMEMVVKLQFETDADEIARLENQAQQLIRKSTIMQQVVWISIRDTYDLWGKGDFRFCKGWKVVEYNSSAPSLGDILGGLFGKGL